MTVLFLETGMLVIALSVDALAAGLAYGAGGIRLPVVSLLTASAVSGLILALSLLAGSLAGESLPAGAVKTFGFLMLGAIGVWKLFDSSDGKNAERADKNQDRLVSPAEALALGAALSADSLAAGIGAGALHMPLLPAAAASFAAGAAALSLGSGIGRRLSLARQKRRGREKEKEDWAAAGRISGFLLLILAFSRLL